MTRGAAAGRAAVATGATAARTAATWVAVREAATAGDDAASEDATSTAENIERGEGGGDRQAATLAPVERSRGVHGGPCRFRHEPGQPGLLLGFGSTRMYVIGPVMFTPQEVIW